jgi:hypothetical protein
MIGPCVHLNIPAIPGIKSMAYTMTSEGPSDPNSEIEFTKQHPTFIFTWGKQINESICLPVWCKKTCSWPLLPNTIESQISPVSVNKETREMHREFIGNACE